MEFDKPRDDCPTSPLKLPNGYVLPQGKLTPNALFVGGIDMKVNANEIRDVFAGFGAIRDVKIISYRGGICKGYGFVYFNEEVDIQTIIEQQVSFKGRKLKLGPAIMKERSSRGGVVPQALPVIGGGNPYTQPYSFSSAPGRAMFPQMPMGYAQNTYTYQYAPAPWAGVDYRTQPMNPGWVQ